MKREARAPPGGRARTEGQVETVPGEPMAMLEPPERPRQMERMNPPDRPAWMPSDSMELTEPRVPQVVAAEMVLTGVWQAAEAMDLTVATGPTEVPASTERLAVRVASERGARTGRQGKPVGRESKVGRGQREMRGLPGPTAPVAPMAAMEPVDRTGEPVLPEVRECAVKMVPAERMVYAVTMGMTAEPAASA